VKVVTVFPEKGDADQHHVLKLILWRHAYSVCSKYCPGRTAVTKQINLSYQIPKKK
jgi:hypothetical protein